VVTDALFAEAARREGHPDNAAAALFGGLVAAPAVAIDALRAVEKPLFPTEGDYVGMFGAIELFPPGVSGAKKPLSSDIASTLANSFVPEQYRSKSVYNNSAIITENRVE
jgi:homoserine kinase